MVSNTKESVSDGNLSSDVKKMLLDLNLPAGLSTPKGDHAKATEKDNVKSEKKNRKRSKNDAKKSKKEDRKRKNKDGKKTTTLETQAAPQTKTITMETEEESQKSASKNIDMVLEDELWFEKLNGLGSIKIDKTKNQKFRVKPDVLEEKRNIAMKKLEQDMHSYQQKIRAMEKKDPDYAWISKVIQNGTLSDKIAAMALKVSHSPVHNLEVLDSLLSMVQKKGRREAKIAMEAVKDIYINNLLPADRHLVPFDERPIYKPKVTENHLVLWYFEDELKNRYLRFIQALQTWTYDNLDHNKRTAINSVFSLLEAKPEQESMLLMVLVNKLGDTDRKIASQVVHLLQQLVLAHPNMRSVITKEVEQFLFQQKLGSRGIYYGVIFLNQIVLDRTGDEELSKKLIDIYIQLFKRVLAVERKHINFEKKEHKKSKKRGHKEQDVVSEQSKTRLLSALLTGVNRAFPYSNSNGDELEEQVNTLFKIVHTGTFSTSTQALMLLLHIMKSKNTVSDRFYRALYSKLLSPELHTTSKQTLFLNLLYRAMKADIDMDRSRAFTKRLLQVACMGSAQFAAGALFLLSSVLQSKPELIRMLRRPSDEKEISEYYADKAKGDEDSALNSDEDEEDDSDDDEDDEEKSDKNKPKLNITGVIDTDKKEQEQAETLEEDTEEKVDSYDPSKRDPTHANTPEGTLAWEFEFLSRHFHPSVRQFVEKMIRSQQCKIEYAGDPLRDFSNASFLDKFVYRNPRKKDLENIKKTSVFGMEGRVGRQGSAATAQAVNSPNFLLQQPEQVSTDQKFFYQFFHQKAKLEGRSLIDDMKAAKKRAKLAKQKANDPFAEFESDDEEEAFAQKLAEKLLRDASGGGDFDPDADIDVNYSSDESEDSDDDEEKVNTNKKKHGEELDEDERAFGDADDFSDVDEADFSLDEEPLDFEGSADDDDSDDEESLEDNKSKGKRKWNKSSSPFADAESFAELMNNEEDTSKKQIEWENRDQHQRSHRGKTNNKSNRKRKGMNKRRRR